MQSATPTMRPPPTGEASPAMSVRLVDGDVVVERELSASRVYVVGRSEEADIPLADASASRRHALLVRAEGGLELEDLASANGTTLEGRPLAPGERQPFPPGQLFSLGDVLGTVLAARVGARPTISDGLGPLTEVLERTSNLVALCALEGASALARVDDVAALVPPEGHVARVDGRRLVVLLPGLDRDRASAWARAVVTSLGRRRAYVAQRVASASGAVSPSVLLAQVIGAPVGKPSRPELPAVGAKPRTSPAMSKLFELVHRVAPTDTNVLVLGETGAGKEVVARTIHARSARATGPFVPLNCAALPEPLLEGELFGYEKGAFTGATQAKPGLVETAAGGTLFLDELGEMPLQTQSKLLRVLEDGAVLRLGSIKPRPVSFRLLAATNREILDEIREKRFRSDLYYRLNGLTLRVPPLRERREEIDDLVALFARAAAERLGRSVPRIAPEAWDVLRRHAWPGNVRELRNVVERLVLLASTEAGLDLLPDEMLADSPAPLSSSAIPAPRSVRKPPPSLSDVEIDLPPSAPPPSSRGTALLDDVARLERERILEALETCAGNQTRAAEMLGITRRVLIGRLEKYGVARPRK